MILSSMGSDAFMFHRKWMTALWIWGEGIEGGEMNEEYLVRYSQAWFKKVEYYLLFYICNIACYSYKITSADKRNFFKSCFIWVKKSPIYAEHNNIYMFPIKWGFVTKNKKCLQLKILRKNQYIILQINIFKQQVCDFYEDDNERKGALGYLDHVQ